MTPLDQEVLDLFLLSRVHPFIVFEKIDGLSNKKAAQRYVLLLLKRDVLETIISDLKEHGRTNESEYGDHTLDYFQSCLKEVKQTLHGIGKKEKDDSNYKEYAQAKSGMSEKDQAKAILDGMKLQAEKTTGKKKSFFDK